MRDKAIRLLHGGADPANLESRESG